MTRPTRGAYRLSESVPPGTTSGGSWIMVVHGVDRAHIVPVNELRRNELRRKARPSLSISEED